MLWCELWSAAHEPLDTQIKEFVNTPLWDDLTDYLQQTYAARPKLAHSCCSMDGGMWKGWNVQYRKKGKSLCTLYPKQGHFIVLVNIGVKESPKADLLIPLCDKYTQNLYNQTESGTSGKALAIDVTSESILCDVKKLVALRVPETSGKYIVAEKGTHDERRRAAKR